VLRYADRKRPAPHRQAAARRRRAAELTGFVLAGDTDAEAWIKTLLEGEHPPGLWSPAAAARRQGVTWLFRRAARWCTCFNVADTTIDAHLAELVSWNGLGPERCGFLGSDEDRGVMQGTSNAAPTAVLPAELKRRVRLARPAGIAATSDRLVSRFTIWRGALGVTDNIAMNEGDHTDGN
jgi:assimilatory nitrate reductase catalytic subunit